MSRPVFSSCSRRRSDAPLMSMYCPPTMPWTPVATASSRIASSTCWGSPCWRPSRSTNASAYRPSPARIATSSPNPRGEGGRRAAAQVVVVHRGQVVVDERVGVDELDRRREREHRFGIHADCAGGGKREHRPDPLAAREQRIAHRLLEPGRFGVGGEAQLDEVALDRVAEVIGVTDAHATAILPGYRPPCPVRTSTWWRRNYELINSLGRKVYRGRDATKEFWRKIQELFAEIRWAGGCGRRSVEVAAV